MCFKELFQSHGDTVLKSTKLSLKHSGLQTLSVVPMVLVCLESNAFYLTLDLLYLLTIQIETVSGYRLKTVM